MAREAAEENIRHPQVDGEDQEATVWPGYSVGWGNPHSNASLPGLSETAGCEVRLGVVASLMGPRFAWRGRAKWARLDFVLSAQAIRRFVYPKVVSCRPPRPMVRSVSGKVVLRFIPASSALIRELPDVSRDAHTAATAATRTIG